MEVLALERLTSPDSTRPGKTHYDPKILILLCSMMYRYEFILRLEMKS